MGPSPLPAEQEGPEEEEDAAYMMNMRRRDEQRALSLAARTNRHIAKAINIAAALQMKLEPVDTSVTWLPAEMETGPLEYKLQLRNPHPIRLQQLITQMKFRLSEGGGECHYYLGVEDDGYPKGLTPHELDTSVSTLQAMASSLQAHVSVVRYFPGAHGRQYVLMRAQQGTREEADYIDLRVAVVGQVDSGKSTLVAVLTHGCMGQPCLDTGRGTARMAVLRHKHEIESGRTSSLSQQLLGYNAEGKVLNYVGVSAAPSPSEVCNAAAKVLTLIDMGGHHRCLKTTLYGMTALLPDFTLLCCSAATGLGRMGREHLAVAVALEVPLIIVLTKVDSVDDAQLDSVMHEIQAVVALLAHPGPTPLAPASLHQPTPALPSASPGPGHHLSQAAAGAAASPGPRQGAVTADEDELDEVMLTITSTAAAEAAAARLNAWHQRRAVGSAPTRHSPQSSEVATAASTAAADAASGGTAEAAAAAPGVEPGGITPGAPAAAASGAAGVVSGAPGTRLGRPHHLQHPVVAVVPVSAVTGQGVAVLHTLLSQLQPAQAQLLPAGGASGAAPAADSAGEAAATEAAALAQPVVGQGSQAAVVAACAVATDCSLAAVVGKLAGTPNGSSQPLVLIPPPAPPPTPTPELCTATSPAMPLVCSPPASHYTGSAAGPVCGPTGLAPEPIAPLTGHPAAELPVVFQVNQTFEVGGVGSVVSGTVVQGVLALGQRLGVGPDAAGRFTWVQVTGIQRAHVPVRRVRAGQSATLAMQEAPLLNLACPPPASPCSPHSQPHSPGPPHGLPAAPPTVPPTGAAAAAAAVSQEAQPGTTGLHDGAALVMGGGQTGGRAGPVSAEAPQLAHTAEAQQGKGASGGVSLPGRAADEQQAEAALQCTGMGAGPGADSSSEAAAAALEGGAAPVLQQQASMQPEAGPLAVMDLHSQHCQRVKLYQQQQYQQQQANKLAQQARQQLQHRTARQWNPNSEQVPGAEGSQHTAAPRLRMSTAAMYDCNKGTCRGGSLPLRPMNPAGPPGTAIVLMDRRSVRPVERAGQAPAPAPALTPHHEQQQQQQQQQRRMVQAESGGASGIEGGVASQGQRGPPAVSRGDPGGQAAVRGSVPACGTGSAVRGTDAGPACAHTLPGMLAPVVPENSGNPMPSVLGTAMQQPVRSRCGAHAVVEEAVDPDLLQLFELDMDTDEASGGRQTQAQQPGQDGGRDHGLLLGFSLDDEDEGDEEEEEEEYDVRPKPRPQHTSRRPANPQAVQPAQPASATPATATACSRSGLAQLSTCGAHAQPGPNGSLSQGCTAHGSPQPAPPPCHAPTQPPAAPIPRNALHAGGDRSGGTSMEGPSCSASHQHLHARGSAWEQQHLRQVAGLYRSSAPAEATHTPATSDLPPPHPPPCTQSAGAGYSSGPAGLSPSSFPPPSHYASHHAHLAAPSLSAPATPLALAPVSQLKGTVLLGPGVTADTYWEFEAVMVLLGGHWPARGLLSGRWPPVGDAAGSEDDTEPGPQSTAGGEEARAVAGADSSTSAVAGLECAAVGGKVEVQDLRLMRPWQPQTQGGTHSTGVARFCGARGDPESARDAVPPPTGAEGPASAVCVGVSDSEPPSSSGAGPGPTPISGSSSCCFGGDSNSCSDVEGAALVAASAAHPGAVLLPSCKQSAGPDVQSASERAGAGVSGVMRPRQPKQALSEWRTTEAHANRLQGKQATSLPDGSCQSVEPQAGRIQPCLQQELAQLVGVSLPEHQRLSPAQPGDVGVVCDPTAAQLPAKWKPPAQARRCRRKARPSSEFAAVIHCANVRQLARLVSLQELGPAAAQQLPPSMLAAARVLHTPVCIPSHLPRAPAPGLAPSAASAPGPRPLRANQAPAEAPHPSCPMAPSTWQRQHQQRVYPLGQPWAAHSAASDTTDGWQSVGDSPPPAYSSRSQACRAPPVSTPHVAWGEAVGAEDNRDAAGAREDVGNYWSDLGTVVRARFRFAQRPEWLTEGSRLLIRDRSLGHVSGAGVISQLVSWQPASTPDATARPCVAQGLGFASLPAGSCSDNTAISAFVKDCCAPFANRRAVVTAALQQLKLVAQTCGP